MQDATAREELAAIRALMVDSQSLLTGTWPHQAVWGTVGTAGLVATWWAVRTGTHGMVGWVWGVALLVGWIFSLRRGMREAGRGRVRNVATRAFGGIWVGLGVTLTLLTSASILAGAVDPRGLPGVIALVFGAGYFATGVVSGLGWLSRVGAAWWTGGVVLLFWREPEALLVLAVMAVVLEVGPALALRRRERTEATPSL